MSLANAAAFFDELRAGELLGPTLSPEEVSGCEAILAACEGWPLSWAAYGLGTAYLETAHSMQPIKEFGGEAYFWRRYDIGGARPDKARELGNLDPGDGARYAGRGYVQLTGKANYRKASVIGEDLVGRPDLALRPDVAARIMRRGMEEGWFTGRRLINYLPYVPAKSAQFFDARRIINGLDRAQDIADHALAFQSALQAGGWS